MPHFSNETSPAALFKRIFQGIIFGRNIFMAKDPVRLIDALNVVINRGAMPETALKDSGL
jgi:DhnA family fructose-bisphosphate aldolase class Ia